jgi:hypothetical protein
MPANGSYGRESGGPGRSSNISRGAGNTSAKSKTKARLGSRPRKSVLTTEQMMENEKTVLLVEKHAQLEDVWNKHDILVCSSAFFALSPIVISDSLGHLGSGDVSYGELYVDDIV